MVPDRRGPPRKEPREHSTVPLIQANCMGVLENTGPQIDDVVPTSNSPPPSQGTRARNTKPSPFAATSKAETSKHSKHDRPVASMNPPLKFVAIAFSDYGGIGFEFYSAVVRPYFARGAA
jgi:hypothetical protein